MATGPMAPSCPVTRLLWSPSRRSNSPQNVFTTGVNRGAAIVVGIASLALVSDVFAAPNVHPGLTGKLAEAHQRVRAFALAVFSGQSAHPIQSANLLREITALHPDISGLAAESSDGGARGAAARSAAVALVAKVSAARALSSLPVATLPSLRRKLGGALGGALGEESDALQLHLQRQADVGCANPHGALFARHGLNAFLAVLISAMLLSLGGWPFASQAVALVGVIVAFSANNPNPPAFATAAVIAMPIAALLAGVTEFLILDGVDQFPLLAIGMAPSILAAALLFTIPNPRLAPIGFLVLVFFPVILSPTNPQSYNPESYLFSSLMAITAVMLLFVLVRTVLPTTDALRRRWCLTSAQAEMRDLLAGSRSARLDDEALFRDADRIGQLAALQPAADDERRDDLRQALDIFGCAAAVRRVRTTLAELSARTDSRLVEGGYLALAACDALGLRRAAANLASTATELDHDARAAARAATLDLIWAAFLFDASPFGLDARRSTIP